MSETAEKTDTKNSDKAQSKRMTIADVQANLDKVVDSTNEAVGSLQDQIATIGDSQNAILEQLKAMSAAHHPTGAMATGGGNSVEAALQDLGGRGVIDDDAMGAMDKLSYMELRDKHLPTKEEYEKFMHEKCLVRIHPDARDNPELFASVSVNGRQFVLARGPVVEIPRYAVYALARSKPHSYTPQKDKDVTTHEKTNVNAYVYREHRYLRFPFEVIKDENPLGPAWLQMVLREDH